MTPQIPLMLFTLFICLSAGILFVESILVVRGLGAKTAMTATIASAVAMVIGGISVFFHLEHWERIFNGFGHLTSGITQELIGIVVMFIVLVVFFLQARKLGEGDTLPKWLGWLGIVVAIAMVCVMSFSYLMAARPMWNNAMLPLFYLGNMVLFGALAMAIIAATKGSAADVNATGLWVKIGVVANIVLMLAYAAFCFTLGGNFNSVGYYLDPTKMTEHVTDLSDFGSKAFTSLGGSWLWPGLIVGGLLPFLGFITGKKDAAASADAGEAALGGNKVATMCAIALICALVGCFLFRGFMYVLGYTQYVIY